MVKVPRSGNWVPWSERARVRTSSPSKFLQLQSFFFFLRSLFYSRLILLYNRLNTHYNVTSTVSISISCFALSRSLDPLVKEVISCCNENGGNVSNHLTLETRLGSLFSSFSSWDSEAQHSITARTFVQGLFISSRRHVFTQMLVHLLNSPWRA